LKTNKVKFEMLVKLVSPKFQKRSALKFAGRNETQTLKT